MNIQIIARDRHGLASTQFCKETPDGGIRIRPPGRHFDYDISPEEFAEKASFAETFQRLVEKNWFTPQVSADFTLLVTSLWLAKDQGWH